MKIRRLVLGVFVGLIGAMVATPAEAAEWCLDDPALIFSAPHASHRITIYATEGVRGSEHAADLAKAKVELHLKPGRAHGTMDIDVHTVIRGDRHQTFQTVLIVSSEPYGAGTIYGSVMGSSNHDMHVAFELVYQDGG